MLTQDLFLTGMGFFIRKLAIHSKPTIVVSKEDDLWTIETVMSMRTLLWRFKLGEETITDGTDGPVKVGVEFVDQRWSGLI